MNLLQKYQIKQNLAKKSNQLFYRTKSQKTIYICHSCYSQSIILNDFILNSKPGYMSLSMIVSNDTIGLLEILSKNFEDKFTVLDDSSYHPCIEIEFSDGRTLLVTNNLNNSFHLENKEIKYLGYDNIFIKKDIEHCWFGDRKVRIVCKRNNISKFLFDKYILNKDKSLGFLNSASLISAEV